MIHASGKPTVLGLSNFLFFQDNTWQDLVAESLSNEELCLYHSLCERRDNATSPAMREVWSNLQLRAVLKKEALLSAPRFDAVGHDFGVVTSSTGNQVFFFISNNCIITVKHIFKDADFCTFQFNAEKIILATNDSHIVDIGQDLIAYKVANTHFKDMVQWRLAIYNNSIDSVVLRAGNKISSGKVVNTDDVDGFVGCNYSSQNGDCGSPVTNGGSLTVVGVHVATNTRENFFTPITEAVKSRLAFMTTSVPKNFQAPANL